MNNRFYKVYTLIMEELNNNILKEASFKTEDLTKHSYLKNVIDDIITNKKIQLNENGSEEFDFSILSKDDEEKLIMELNDFLNNLNLNNIPEELKKLNKILKESSNGTVVWSKIYKGKYSRIN